jgi:ribosomal protein S18 acetylase RimI-like enzyme
MCAGCKPVKSFEIIWPFEIVGAGCNLCGMSEQADIFYACEPDLDLAEFRRVLVESGLGATRPVDDGARLQAMLSGANLVLTARLGHSDGTLVGVARSVTDFHWICYVSELAVSASAQGLGIGKGLLGEMRRRLGPAVAITLVSMPDAVGFYERAGMKRMADSFWYDREK